MQGGLAINLMHFARALRAAGLPVGPGKLLQAVEAVEVVGIGNRADFYWALHAVFVNRRDQREVFDQAFHVFWRNPDILKRMMGMMLPTIRTESLDTQDPLSRRVADALRGTAPEAEGPEKSEIEVDASFTVSAQERLQEKDFEKMSAAEMAEAKRMLARIALPVAEVTTRRHRPDPRGPRVDPRATLRRMLRSGGDLADLARRSRRTRPPPLVVLCDISGSMTRYSRMLLHFMHALSNDRDRVHSFVFGTRLTNITRHLRHKDVDVALDAVSAAVADWSGGTRIGTALHAFNRTWARRVLGQGAVVLLITDGLDRDAGEGLAAEAERLHKSCRRLVWLNPLLRWEGFAPKSSGIRALLPHVDDFRPVHNLNSLAGLADALNRDGPRRAESLRKWLKEAA
ncbi:vWA domain-containing protein [Azospirillum brasilense]|uniref:vWA domain-containing protein n=1 Tax=Azospirillum brasilense TaxID=192 RepID=UPI000E67A65C|nr:VWA domain-containing protein [Azospirillum brasilense]NUB24620.1 VWA domain-containing protein [Azospirillum brasilense]NUB31566.1 VWA domain-containing protein [Azospirillum brasilense]RIW02746.1 VWA domain-containing protein [Azospirillum brasilense]